MSNLEALLAPNTLCTAAKWAVPWSESKYGANMQPFTHFLLRNLQAPQGPPLSLPPILLPPQSILSLSLSLIFFLAQGGTKILWDTKKEMIYNEVCEIYRWWGGLYVDYLLLTWFWFDVERIISECFWWWVTHLRWTS